MIGTGAGREPGVAVGCVCRSAGDREENRGSVRGGRKVCARGGSRWAGGGGVDPRVSGGIVPREPEGADTGVLGGDRH